MNDQIIKLIGEIVGAVFAGILLYVMPKIRAWFVGKIGEQKEAKLWELVSTFCQAAEQMLKAEDPTGEKRKKYVVDQLTKLGYAVTEEINAMIESTVFNIPKSENEDNNG